MVERKSHGEAPGVWGVVKRETLPDADPGFELSIEWLDTREKLIAAEKRQKDPSTKSRVLVICGSSRNDKTCPGEMSKTFRLTKIAQETLEGAGIETDLLDLSY